MRGLVFNEFQLGQRFTTARRTVTDYDVRAYVTLTGFLEPLFIDADYIREKSLLGRAIVPGGLTFALAEGLVVQTGIIHGTGRAFVGLDKMKLTTPLEIGETIEVRVEVLALKEHKSGGGFVTFKHDVTAGRPRRPVMEFEITRLISRALYEDGQSLKKPYA
jgi:acyl dehydratase